MKVDNYRLKGTRAQHFSGPRSSEHQFKTAAALLRAVADWIESEGIQDPEFDQLTTKVAFESDNDDEFYETATLYYRLEGEEHDK